MKHHLLMRVAQVFVFAGALALVTTGAGAKMRKGIVIVGPASAIDGDTLVIGSTHIRIWGIDAPNLGAVCTRKGKDWKPSGEARDALFLCIKWQTVTCRTQKWEGSRKRYVAECWNNDGEDLAACMVRGGWAVDFTCYSGSYYLRLEAEPKTKEAGIWQCDGGPKPPLIKRWGSKGESIPCDRRTYKPEGPPKSNPPG
jgi:endonuclease YncB( thermonuclease family)